MPTTHDSTNPPTRRDVQVVIAIRFQDRRRSPDKQSPDDWFGEPLVPEPPDPVDAASSGSYEEMVNAMWQLFSPISPYGTVIMPDGTVREFDETGVLPIVQTGD